MPLKVLLKSKKGQSRILEAVIAAAIIFIVFSVSIYFIQASDIKVLQERADLDRLGYNTLHRLVESGTIEATIEKRITDAALIKTIIQKSLPSATIFNLTIFNLIEQDSWIKLDPIEFGYFGTGYLSISNAQEEAFEKALEVSSTSMTYTSKNGNIYLVVLVLTKAGGS